MQFSEFLHPDHILPELSARTKTEVLAELVKPVIAYFPSISLDAVVQILLERERLGSTAIGDGIAIPHGKVEGLDRMVVVVGRSTHGVDFDSVDHKPVHIIALVLAPMSGAGMHLKVLASLARLLRDAGFRQSFLSAPPSQLFALMTSSPLA